MLVKDLGLVRLVKPPQFPPHSMLHYSKVNLRYCEVQEVITLDQNHRAPSYREPLVLAVT